MSSATTGHARPGEIRVLILGTGAMACLVGAHLARTGRADVTLAGTWTEALDTLARDGISVEEQGHQWSAPVATVTLEAAPFLGPFEFVLVLVKSARTAAVAPVAARALTPRGIVVTLQNGLGNRETLQRAVAPGRVAAGVATIGATLLGPGRVRGFPGQIVLGIDASTEPEVRRLATLLADSGLPTKTTAGLESHQWRKLAVNCAINPLSALLGVTNGALLGEPEPRATLMAAAREVGAVAKARGIDMGADDPADLALEVARLTAGNLSSMLQDLRRGVTTEIESMNGAVEREGRRLGIATPVNARMSIDVSKRERGLADDGVSSAS